MVEILPIKQEAGQETLAPKLTKAEAQLDWSQSADQIVNKILGFAPNPGATTKFRGEILRITRACTSEVTIPIGRLVLADGKVLVGSSTSSVELLQVTPAGKKSMAASAWANGARFSDGETLE